MTWRSPPHLRTSARGRTKGDAIRGAAGRRPLRPTEVKMSTRVRPSATGTEFIAPQVGTAGGFVGMARGLRPAKSCARDPKSKGDRQVAKGRKSILALGSARNRLCAYVALVVGLSLLPWPRDTWASTIFESATLGPPSLGGGFTVNFLQYVGVKFEVIDDATVERIGLHLGALPGSVFGVIVRLDSVADSPDSPDLSTPDVLGHAVLLSPPFPGPSGEVSAPLSVDLSPGYYDLIFGAGLFGTAGDGSFVPGRDTNIGQQSYILSNNPVGSVYQTLPSSESTAFRMFLEGEGVGRGIPNPMPNPRPIPEPSSLLLLSFGLAGMIVMNRRTLAKRRRLLG